MWHVFHCREAKATETLGLLVLNLCPQGFQMAHGALVTDRTYSQHQIHLLSTYTASVCCVESIQAGSWEKLWKNICYGDSLKCTFTTPTPFFMLNLFAQVFFHWINLHCNLCEVPHHTCGRDEQVEEVGNVFKESYYAFLSYPSCKCCYNVRYSC